MFAEAPRAYAAVRVMQGGTSWEADSLNQHHDHKGPPGPGLWLKCLDEFSPVIMEAARKSDYPSFAAFQQAILDNRLTWKNQRLDYRSTAYKTLLTLFADYSKAPHIDGLPVDYSPSKVYDSPFVQGNFGEGTITLSYGKKNRVLDFTEE